MKHTRKLLSLLLAVIMVMGLATTALAANETSHTIEIANEKTGHTYEAYQVFKGDYTGGFLTNVEWGSGVNGENLLTALKAKNATLFGACKDAADVADVLRNLSTTQVSTLATIINANLSDTDAGSATAPAEGKYSINVTGDGYYFIKDAARLSGHDAATSFILEVAGSATIEVTPKSDVPQVKKSVDEVNDSQTAEKQGGDSASYDIGDTIQFHLTATLPTKLESYETYKLVFKDKLSAGLTFNKNSVTVTNTHSDSNVTSSFTVSDPVVGEDGYSTVTITCNNVKEIAENGNVIRVDYTATLNENADTGNPGNPNMASVQFSNDPYSDQMGETPEDKVVVFTYKVIINKVQPGTPNNNPLVGAAFKLEKELPGADNYKLVKEFTVDETKPVTSFEFKGLDAGIYKLTETETPDGFNTIEPITFKIVDTRDTNADNPTLTDLDGQPLTGEIKFTKELSNGSLTADILNKQGAALPSTGGIGTTIFYVVGVILVLGAGVLLVTKKRTAKR